MKNEIERSRGVGGRKIVVLRSTNHPLHHQASRNGSDSGNGEVELSTVSSKTQAEFEGENAQTSSDPSTLISPPRSPVISNILELEEEEALDSPSQMPAQQTSLSQHIAFVETQRNPTDNVALRISGPRENSRNREYGSDDQIDQTLAMKSDASQENRHTSHDCDIHQLYKNNNTTPQIPKLDGARPSGTQRRSHSRKPWSIRATSSRDRDTAPYLSWQPTIGRNSNFVGLTADQKEELGGIEYRSLKTLGAVLIGMLYPITIYGLNIVAELQIRS
jgi:hypothetical protein